MCVRIELNTLRPGHPTNKEQGLTSLLYLLASPPCDIIRVEDDRRSQTNREGRRDLEKEEEEEEEEERSIDTINLPNSLKGVLRVPY